MNSIDIALGIMYRPPSADKNYYNEMLNQLDFIHSKFDKVLLMGDLNYNYMCDSSANSKPIPNMEALYDMNQLITEAKRVTLTTSTLIDVMLSNIPELHVKTGVYQISISDHYMIYSVLNYEKVKPLHRKITFKNYKNFDCLAFTSEL